MTESLQIRSKLFFDPKKEPEIIPVKCAPVSEVKKTESPKPEPLPAVAKSSALPPSSSSFGGMKKGFLFSSGKKSEPSNPIEEKKRDAEIPFVAPKDPKDSGFKV